QNIKRYYKRPYLLLAFFRSVIRVPWIKCFKKWKRDYNKTNYQHYIEALFNSNDKYYIEEVQRVSDV
ncbi:MAG: hypothetical protein ACOCWC_06100, partial [Bacteroidota bacterium]